MIVTLEVTLRVWPHNGLYLYAILEEPTGQQLWQGSAGSEADCMRALERWGKAQGWQELHLLSQEEHLEA